jgi:predicted dehydrogenase
MARGFVDAVLEDSLTPSSWTRYEPLPTGVDGLRQTQVVCRIVESAEKGEAVDLTL